MGRYCTSSDCASRYERLTTVANSWTIVINSHFIFYAENELDSKLASKFTVPFSSNNVTVKDLSIDMTYIRAGNLKAEEREELMEHVKYRINGLLDGSLSMLTTSGDAIAGVGETVWSNTQGYHPVFGIGDTKDFRVDSEQVYDEAIARGDYV